MKMSTSMAMSQLGQSVASVVPGQMQESVIIEQQPQAGAKEKQNN